MLAPRRKKAPAGPIIKSVHVPAPVGGINSIDAMGEMNPLDCVLLFNMIADDYGLRARLGHREWCAGLTGAGDNYVRTIIPYKGSAENGSLNRLFATTSSGIWDVTDSGAVTTPHAGVTDYEVGDFVSAGGLAFACVDDGTSHGSNGLPSLWAPLTLYSVGARVINGDNVYACLTTGFSGAGDGPTGTGTGIADGGTLWDYVSSKDNIPDGFARWAYVPNNVEPTLVLSFASTANRAGHGTWHVNITSAGHFLYYWDEENGLHIYTEAAGTWAAVTQGVGPTQIDGVDPADLVAGTVWKGFTIHIERDSTRAWIMAAASLYGTATPLDVGMKAKAGGNMVNAWSWTYDGGSGLDDALVFATRGGDILIYQGTNPTDADLFGLQGVWQVGDLPAGREVMTDRGGELLVITRSGLLPMSVLVKGKSLEDQQYETAKIAPIFKAAMQSKANHFGWSARLHPKEGAFIVTVPNGEGQASSQLAMSMTKKSWAIFRDLPAYSMGVFDGDMYLGTVDGTVCVNDTYVDGQPLYDPAEYTPVQFSGIGAFRNLGRETEKQVQIIKPYFTGAAPPGYAVDARYDFNINELPAVDAATPTGAVWGAAVWGLSLWGNDYSPTSGARGATGMGTNVALAWRGAAINRTVLTGFGVKFVEAMS